MLQLSDGPLRPAALGVLLLTGCRVELPPQAYDCGDDAPHEEPFAAVACEPELFPCPPSASLAGSVLGAEDFDLVQDGQPLDLWWGVQEGYHFFTAVQTTGLCSVVFVDFRIEVEAEDGSREVIQQLERHVQTVRCEDQPDLFPGVDCTDRPPSLQRWWRMELAVPCRYHPDDPDHEAPCPDERTAHIEDLDVVISVEVRDHNGDDDPSLARSARDEKRIVPTCCG